MAVVTVDPRRRSATDSPLTEVPAPATGVDRLHRTTRALLGAYVGFTALAAFSLLGLGEHTETFFAWPIASRPNSAFLGAAYAAGCVLSVLALTRRRWNAIRVPVVTVTGFTVLTLVPTLLHRHRLNLMAEAASARMAAQLWMLVYLLVPVLGAIVIVRQERALRRQPTAPVRRMPRPLVAVLLAQGAAMAAVGAILYAGGTTMHRTIDVQRPGWPWPVTPLTSMVIGAWLLSFAVAVTLAVLAGDLGRMLVPAVAYAAFGAFELAVLITHRTAPGTSTAWCLAGAGLAASLVPTGVYGALASTSRAAEATIPSSRAACAPRQ